MSRPLAVPCHIPGWFEDFVDRQTSLDKSAHFHDEARR